MTNYKRDPAPEAGPGWYVSDETPVPRHASTDSLLYGYAFDEDFPPRLDCPGDCGKFCEPANLGEAVDWALCHRCFDDGELVTPSDTTPVRATETLED